MQIPAERLDQIAHRFAELEARMASGTLEGDAFVKASRDYAELEPVASIANDVKAMREEITGLEEMLADPERKAMAEEPRFDVVVVGAGWAGIGVSRILQCAGFKHVVYEKHRL